MEQREKIKAEIREYYNKMFSSRNDTSKHELPHKIISPAERYFKNRKLNVALSLANLKPNTHILEIGCATGIFSFMLTEQGFLVTGLDISDEAVAKANKIANHNKIKEANFVQGDVENMKFPDNSFDCVFSFSAFRYLPDLNRALREVYRVLKPGGVAVIDFPNKYCPWFKHLKTKFGVNIHIHDHHYGGREVKSFFENANFKKVEYKKILFTPTETPSYLLPFFKIIDFVGEKTPLFKEMAGIIMCKGIK
jgi:ubiquinone/menaquinone biosynthesis C-methylase UbiE